MQRTDSADAFLLIDMSHFDQLSMLEQRHDYGVVKVGAGVLTEDLYRFLDEQKTPSGSPSGYAFNNTPAPGDITVAGMMAIGGHGTGVEYEDSTESLSFNGCISNTVLALTAVVWSDSKSEYEVREFLRSGHETAAFLVHVGRAFIIDYSLQVVPNYNLRCMSFTDISWKELFAANAADSEFSVTNLLNKYGRLETIWFPFTDTPWLKIWQNSPEKPQESVATTKPYNYRFSDSIPAIATDLLGGFLKTFSGHVKGFGKFQVGLVKLGLRGSLDRDSLSEEMASEGIDAAPYLLEQTPNWKNGTADIWGPAYHTLLYVRKETLRVTANGYAVIVPRSRVQEVLHRFSTKYLQLLEEYAARDLYPVLGPVEYRFTGLDGVQDLRSVNAQPPALSAVAPEIGEIPEHRTRVDDDMVAIWLDLLTIPGASGLGDFYEEIEQWLFEHYPARRNRVEWSKGWAYTKDGAWSNNQVISKTVPQSFDYGEMTFEQASAILKKYDPANNFATKLAEQLFA